MSDPESTAHAPDVAAIRAQVLARRPVDDRERASIGAFVQHLDNSSDPFDEHAHPVHVTASAIVVGRRGVVLHRHKRLGFWLQPGGHIDAGEMPWDAAVREAREETGLEVELAEPDGVLAHVDVHPGPRRHTHLDLRYIVHAPDADPAPPAHESQDVQWFQWHRAIAIAEPGLEGILRALQPGQPVLRSSRPSDARECAHVYLRSRRFAIPEVPPIHDEADVRRWMADEVIPHEDVTVAEIDGTIVGLMVLGRDPRRRSGWIEQLYLDPAWMGRGLGVRFVERAQAALPEGLQLWTFEANGGARRFYERLGFEAVEHTDGAANEERAPDVHYVWLPASSERDTLRSESGHT